MKVCYDRKSNSRYLEPRERILVLFPVVDNPCRQNTLEEDTKSEARLGNDQQPIKLQMLLNDLGTKLSHLPSVQRNKSAEVINQYRKVFPDAQIRLM